MRKEIVEGLLGNAFLKAMSMLLLLASGVLLARVLGASSYGEYVFLISIITMLGLPAQGGLQTLIVRETARYNNNENWSCLKGLLYQARKFVLFLTISISFLSLCVILFGWVGVDFDGSAFIWALLLIPIWQLNYLRGAVLRGLRKVVQGEVPDQIVRPAIMVLVFSLFLYLNVSVTVEAAIQVAIVAALVAFVIGGYLLRRNIPKEVRVAEKQFEHRDWMASYWPLAVFTWVQITNAQVAILLLGTMGESEQVGLYYVALQGASFACVSLTVINTVIAPHIVHLYAGGNIRELQRLLTRGAQLATLISLSVLVLYFFYSGVIVELLYGSEYKAAGKAMVIISIGYVISAAMGSVGIALQMLGYEKNTLNIMVISFLINVVLSIVLIPQFGIEGAAVSYAISIAAWNVLLVKKLNRATTLSSTIFKF